VSPVSAIILSNDKEADLILLRSEQVMGRSVVRQIIVPLVASGFARYE
jgi:hypothetical protein